MHQIQIWSWTCIQSKLDPTHACLSDASHCARRPAKGKDNEVYAANKVTQRTVSMVQCITFLAQVKSWSGTSIAYLGVSVYTVRAVNKDSLWHILWVSWLAPHVALLLPTFLCWETAYACLTALLMKDTMLYISVLIAKIAFCRQISAFRSIWTTYELHLEHCKCQGSTGANTICGLPESCAQICGACRATCNIVRADRAWPVV